MTAINYSKLPAHMQAGCRRYVENGIGGGSFMTAVFSNQSVQAFARADVDNTAAMWDWANFLYNEAPSGCHGSPEKVAAWVKAGGLNGLEAARLAAQAVSNELGVE